MSTKQRLLRSATPSPVRIDKILRSVLPLKCVRVLRGWGCNVLGTEPSTRRRTGRGLIDRGALRCSIYYLLPKIWRRGAARGRRPHCPPRHAA